MNVQMRVYSTQNIHNSSILVHIHQKEKIALEIATKIACVNGPYKNCSIHEK
jgi:hypothetical protein